MGGLSRISGGRIDTYTQLNSGLSNDVVYGVGVLGDYVWTATAAGASRLNTRTGQWALYNERNTPMTEIWTYAVYPGTDKVYYAVWGSGLLEYDVATERWKGYDDPDGETEIVLFKDEGLIHEITTSVSYVDKIVWVATYFGDSRYDGRSWHNFLTKDSGLPSNFTNTVKGVDANRAWFGTEKASHITTARTGPSTAPRPLPASRRCIRAMPTAPSLHYRPTPRPRTTMFSELIFRATTSGSPPPRASATEFDRNNLSRSLIMNVQEVLNAIATAPATMPIEKRAVTNLNVLNEAYDYEKPSSFARAMRIDLNGVVILLISGTASIDEYGKTVHVGDFRAQLHRTYDNITGLLAAEGATWKDIVRTTCYLRDIERDYEAFNEERTAFFKEQQLDPIPASTGIQAILCRPDLLIEIEAIAMFRQQKA